MLVISIYLYLASSFFNIDISFFSITFIFFLFLNSIYPYDFFPLFRFMVTSIHGNFSFTYNYCINDTLFLLFIHYINIFIGIIGIIHYVNLFINIIHTWIYTYFHFLFAYVNHLSLPLSVLGVDHPILVIVLFFKYFSHTTKNADPSRHENFLAIFTTRYIFFHPSVL